MLVWANKKKASITKTYFTAWKTLVLVCWSGTPLALEDKVLQGITKKTKTRRRLDAQWEQTKKFLHSTWGVWWYQCLLLAYQHGKCLNNRRSVRGDRNKIHWCENVFHDCLPLQRMNLVTKEVMKTTLKFFLSTAIYLVLMLHSHNTTLLFLYYYLGLPKSVLMPEKLTFRRKCLRHFLVSFW